MHYEDWAKLQPVSMAVGRWIKRNSFGVYKMTARRKNWFICILNSLVIISLLVAPQKCFSQTGSISTPLRTYSLNISIDAAWITIEQAVIDSQFMIKSVDPYRRKILAIGEPYEVPVGITKKLERKRLVVELHQLNPGIYHLFVTVEIIEFWPVYNRWTPKSRGVDVTEDLISFGTFCSNKLRPYFKATKP